MSSSFGYEASREIIADDDLPVDIHHRKFAQWLVDRRKAPKDWHDKLRAILLKVDALARNLPATLTRCTGECVPDPHILAPSDGVEPVRWDYYRARLVRDKIIAGASTVKDATNDDDAEAKGAEGADTAVHDASKEATRGLFGRLAGKAREWDDIVRMYERDNIHLAEAQMTMNQLVDYDVPHHKSHAQRRGKQLADLERRESEHRRAAVVAATRFIATCTDVGVSPLDAKCAGGRRVRESVGSSVVESVRFDLRGVRGGGANGCGGRGDGTLRAMDAMGARHRRRGHRRRVATVARVHPRV
jgi:hypothetical protein